MTTTQGDRSRAIQISDALVAAGISHTVVVGVHEKMMRRETYHVNVTPLLVYEPMDITRLQRLADSLHCEVAYINGSFTFVERTES